MGCGQQKSTSVDTALSVDLRMFLVAYTNALRASFIDLSLTAQLKEVKVIDKAL